MAYVTTSGDTNCCDHDVVNKQCNGNIICSLSPNPPNGIQTCTKLYADEWAKRATRFCPVTMPNYFGAFERGAGKPEGCSVSVSTTDGSGPQNPGQPQCKVYSSQEDNRTMSDSCETANESKLYDMCVDNVKRYGFVPKVTWGRTPQAQRNRRCDDALCKYWRLLYKDMEEVPMTYHASVSSCGIPQPPPDDYSMCYYKGERIGKVENTPDGRKIQYTPQQCKLLNGTLDERMGTACFKPGKAEKDANDEFGQAPNRASRTKILKKYLLDFQCVEAPVRI